MLSKEEDVAGESSNELVLIPAEEQVDCVQVYNTFLSAYANNEINFKKFPKLIIDF